jgi:hypothetical protein
MHIYIIHIYVYIRMYIYTSLAHGARVLRRVRAPSASSSALANACRAPRVAPVCVCVCVVCVSCVCLGCVCVFCVYCLCVYTYIHTHSHTHTHTHTHVHTHSHAHVHTPPPCAAAGTQRTATRAWRRAFAGVHLLPQPLPTAEGTTYGRLPKADTSTQSPHKAAPYS